MSHHYIITAQKPTAVTACVTGNKNKTLNNFLAISRLCLLVENGVFYR